MMLQMPARDRNVHSWLTLMIRGCTVLFKTGLDLVDLALPVGPENKPQASDTRVDE